MAVTDEVDFSAWPPPPDPSEPTTAMQGSVPRRRRPWRVVYWCAFGLLCAAAVGLGAGFVLTFGSVRVGSSTTMAPTIPSGSVLGYQRGASGIVRGDVVLVRPPGGGLLVRRVMALPGDRVTCCDSAGRVDVDGKGLVEDYLPSGVAPSQAPFAVTLGAGQVWLMADNRAIAVDSRIWGPLPTSDIVGRVVEAEAAGGWTRLQTPEGFIADGLASADHRDPNPFLLLGLASLALLAVIGQGTVGVIRWAVRRRRKRRQRQDGSPTYA